MADNRRSKVITQGLARTPNRAMMRAVGFTGEDFDKRIVGVGNAHSTITPSAVRGEGATPTEASGTTVTARRKLGPSRVRG